jgi:PAS domain S-box-containing protein
MLSAATKMVRTLYGRITLGVVLIVLFTVLTNIFVVRHQVELTMRQARDDHARNFLQSTLANVEAQYRGLQFHKQTAMDLRKKEILDVVEFAMTVVRDFHARAKSGEMTTSTAQSLALKVLRSYRYDNGTGYVWVNNVDRPLPRILMHPILPELDGVVVDDPQYYTAYGQHIHLFKAFVDLCLAQGAGYVDYLWPKPTKEGLSSLQKKVSFVRLFPEWGWVIGSGLYIDDIDAEVQRKIKGIVNDLNETLGPLTIGTAGYLFVFDSDDTILVHPSKVGQDLKGLVDPLTGMQLSVIFRKAAAAPDNSISYIWDKPGDEGHYVYMKRAHVFHFKPLDWYIATTVYDDENREASNRLLRNLLFLGLLLLVCALLACLPLVRSLVRPMTLLSRAAEQIAKQGLNSATIPLGGTEEVRQLSAVLAHMISSIRLSQQQLLESEEKYRSMMEAMGDMVFICSADGVIEYMNPSMIRFFGRDASRLRCQEALSECRIFCEGCGRSPSVLENVGFRLVHFGEGRHYHVTSCPVTHSDGSVSMMSIIRDVSDQTRAEAGLREAQQHIQNIINSMPSMVIGLDRAGRIDLWNKQSEQILGLDAEQIRGKDMSVLPRCLAFLHGMFQSSMETGEVVKKNKVALMLSNDHTFCDVTVYPLDDDHGAVIRIDDVSELVRLEEIMIQSDKMLSVGGLAAGMAHEINNPLAGIVQNAQVIRNRLREDLHVNVATAQECGTRLEGVFCYLERRNILAMLDMIVDSGVRAAKIVSNMLSFVRKSDELKRPEDLALLMDKTVELVMNDYDLKKNYDFRQIEIIREYAPDVPRVMCEASKIQQVFMNLLKNGAQAMAEVPERASRFILRIGFDGEAVKVEVEDNGGGLSDSVRKRIFEPFFTTKPPGIGTGLGLSISYFIVVEHHGGVMRVETVPGQMSNFIMLFPPSPESEGTPSAETV